VPLQPTERGVAVWLTKRPDGMTHHAREISFPGGKREAGDRSLLATALRELTEEVGVPASDVVVLGSLPPVPTATSRFALHPFVVAVARSAQPLPSPAEVQELLRVDLEDMLDGRVSFRAVAVGGHASPIFDIAGSGSVYGATAYVLEEVLERYAATQGRVMPQPVFTEEIPWA
jgi:8-oxo-dGTP pyrophosphatase MutT (NUDIX family)